MARRLRPDTPPPAAAPPTPAATPSAARTAPSPQATFIPVGSARHLPYPALPPAHDNRPSSGDIYEAFMHLQRASAAASLRPLATNHAAAAAAAAARLAAPTDENVRPAHPRTLPPLHTVLVPDWSDAGFWAREGAADPFLRGFVTPPAGGGSPTQEHFGGQQAGADDGSAAAHRGRRGAVATDGRVWPDARAMTAEELREYNRRVIAEDRAENERYIKEAAERKRREEEGGGAGAV